MTDLEPLLRALTQGDVVAAPVVPRPGEVHCRIAAASVVAVSERLCAQLGADLLLMAADDRRAHGGGFVVHYLFAHQQERWLVVASVLRDESAPVLSSLAPFHLPASRFEREIRDQFGIEFTGHPDPRPLVRHGFWPEDWHPMRQGASPPPPFTDDGQPFPFTMVGGEGVYEIPVGPVHAGVIEPGHFRFSVLGETIIDMKSRLYFTHKGTEKLFEGRVPADGVELAERVSGDTSVGHALAYAQAIEAATGIAAPRRARYVRTILLELERLYNHVGDFGAIANDTGFAVANAHCQRIRERLLRLNKALTGSRLLRGLVAPGGLSRNVEGLDQVVTTVESALADFEEVAAISLGNTLLMDRLEGTGVLEGDAARDYGVLGFVARASGVDTDARRDHPFAAYDRLAVRVPVMTAGDVKARTLVRLEEARESVSIVKRACHEIPGGPVHTPAAGFEAFRAAIGIVEAWRGRLVHFVMLTGEGRLHRVKIVDPSFLNWPALSRALVDNIVPDFPLCNKSFNQSYSGNDL